MDWLNYHHLYYFWVVAKEGSVTAASEQLRLAQPTVSAQLRQLERSLGAKLFMKRGRNLALTDTGRMVFHRADKIFSLGRELMDAIKGRTVSEPRLRLNVGIVDIMPKIVVHRLLEPATKLDDKVCLVCREGKAPDLLARLAVYEFDLVLAEAPIGPHAKVRAFNHLLGECDATIFGTRALAARYRKGFPQSLHGAPMLLPTPNTSLRRALDAWFQEEDLVPSIEGEFEDSALIKVFGQTGLGLFAAPSVVQEEITKRYGVVALGSVPAVREAFYAISTERRITHPGVLAITQGAQQTVFAG
jgi:LysR family transcriptional activator of nhaA